MLPIWVSSHGTTPHRICLSTTKGTQTLQTVAKFTKKAYWPKATYQWASSNPLQKISTLLSSQLPQSI